jgi:hypothetical protein
MVDYILCFMGLTDGFALGSALNRRQLVYRT